MSLTSGLVDEVMYTGSCHDFAEMRQDVYSCFMRYDNCNPLAFEETDVGTWVDIPEGVVRYRGKRVPLKDFHYARLTSVLKVRVSVFVEVGRLPLCNKFDILKYIGEDK